MRRFGVVIPLIFVGLVLGFTLTNSEANAHAPSDIYLNEITQSQIKKVSIVQLWCAATPQHPSGAYQWGF